MTSAHRASISQMPAVVRAFVRDESGATSIEYGMIAALISIAIVSAATQLGNNVSAVWGKVAANMK